VTCPCGVDHWLHVATGFQGIVGMMVNLQAHHIPVSDAAMRKMEEQLAKLQERVDIARKQRQATA